MPARKKSGKKIAKKKNLRRKGKTSFLRKIAKFQALFAGLILTAYLTVGFGLGSGAFQRDIEGKVAGATAVLSQHFTGPPGKPVVTASAGCTDSQPYIAISWAFTDDTESYDVYRDGALLVGGITNNSYQDMAVTLATGYDYYVIANGPLGTNQSDAVAKTAPSECYVPPIPTPEPVPEPIPPPPPDDAVCRIISLDKIQLANFRCLPKTKKKRPFFTGTTNVSNANILAEISTRSSKRKVISSFKANENGYWSWRVQGKLKKRTHIISVKSTDPADPGRSGTCALRFKVSKKTYSKKQMKKCVGAVAYRALAVPPGYSFSKPLDLRIGNNEKYFFTGDKVDFEADFKNAFPDRSPEQKFSFQLADAKGNTVYETEIGNLPDENGKITQSLKIPLHAGSGRYKIIAQTSSGEETMAGERELTVEEKPFIRLGSGWSLSYARLFSHLGWAFIFLAAILLFFSGLLAFEYHLSQYAALQVTEKKLKKEGYID